MGMIGKALKLGVLVKVVQVVQREASKPENREKISAAVSKYRSRNAGAQGQPPT